MTLGPLRRRLRPLIPRAMRRGLRGWLADDRTHAEIFGAIYRDGVWGGDGGDFHSGLGSYAPDLIEPYVGAVRAFLSERPSRPIVIDVGCGDFVASNRLADVAAAVVACDVVPALIGTAAASSARTSRSCCSTPSPIRCRRATS